MRANVTKRDDLWSLRELGGTFQNPAQTEPSPLWGGSFDFAGNPIDESGAYVDDEPEMFFAYLNGSPAVNLHRATRHPSINNKVR